MRSAESGQRIDPRIIEVIGMGHVRLHPGIAVPKPVEIFLFVLLLRGWFHPSVMVDTGGYRLYEKRPSVLSKTLRIAVRTDAAVVAHNAYFLPVPLRGIPDVIVGSVKMHIVKEQPFH